MNRAFRKRVQRLLDEKPVVFKVEEPVQRTALELSETYRRRTLELLAEVTPETAPQVAERLGDAVIEGTDAGVAAAGRLLEFPEPLECGPGCAFCCHEPLQVAIVDAVNLARERLTFEYQLPTRDGAELKALFDPCPYLGGDQRCTVYARRPVVCRAFQSTSVKRCRQIYEERDPRRGAPTHMTLFGFTGLALDGMHEAFDQVGIDRAPVVLGLAAQALAADFEGRTRTWLSGGLAFGDVAVLKPRVRPLPIR